MAMVQDDRRKFAMSVMLTNTFRLSFSGCDRTEHQGLMRVVCRESSSVKEIDLG
jgi:hypothetical protein